VIPRWPAATTRSQGTAAHRVEDRCPHPAAWPRASWPAAAPRCSLEGVTGRSSTRTGDYAPGVDIVRLALGRAGLLHRVQRRIPGGGGRLPDHDDGPDYGFRRPCGPHGTMIGEMCIIDPLARGPASACRTCSRHWPLLCSDTTLVRRGAYAVGRVARRLMPVGSLD